MTSNISFYGNNSDSTGSIGEKHISNSLSESTGSIGYKAFGYEPIPDIDRTLERDTVSFHGHSDYDNDSGSPMTTVLGVAGMATLAAAVGLGYAYKTNAISKVKNPKIQNWLNKAAEPCYKLCHKTKTISKNWYDKAVNFVKKK